MLQIYKFSIQNQRFSLKKSFKNNKKISSFLEEKQL